MARSDNTDFVFEVLEGPAAGAVIPLSGRQMPYRAGAGGQISYGRTQRTKLTWYQGNPVASQQILGRTLDPTSINGVWKERYLGEDAPIDLVELFEELLDFGCQVRVSWETIERQGIVKAFKWYPGDPVGGLSDIRWEMTLEWISAGTPPRRVVGEAEGTMRDGLVRGAVSLSDLAEHVGRLIDNVGSFVGQAKTAFQSIKTSLQDAKDALAKPIETISTSAARIGDQDTTPSRLLEDAATAIGSAQETAGSVAEITAGIFPGVSTVGDSLEASLLDAIARYDLIDTAHEALVACYTQRVRLEEILRPPAFVTVPALVGSDLRALALKYYGRADDWTRIAQQNGIETSVVPPDVEELVIPLSLPDATDPAQQGT